ncbi:MAG: hypothetical protein IT365_21185 [Candidatus Hydrogenedentes bacterium]|nr:hypothetical protein [Candidatus Hydrogenedentota bacterium]
MRYVVSMLILCSLCGCQQKNGTPDIDIPPEDFLDDGIRAELALPAKDELTLATNADVQFVKTLSREVIAAVEQSVTPQSAEFRIAAARPVGGYLLLWIGFPEVMDGGEHVIYSVEKKKLVGTFLGGYSG